jgi:hypothetical protein
MTSACGKTSVALNTDHRGHPVQNYLYFKIACSSTQSEMKVVVSRHKNANTTDNTVHSLYWSSFAHNCKKVSLKNYEK